MMANIASNIFSALFLFPGAGLLILLSLVFICSFASYIGGKFYNAVKWVSFGIVISCVLICSLLWLVPKEILMPAYGVEAVDTSILALRFELTVVYLGIMCLCLFNFSWMRFLDKQSYVILLDQDPFSLRVERRVVASSFLGGKCFTGSLLASPVNFKGKQYVAEIIHEFSIDSADDICTLSLFEYRDKDMRLFRNIRGKRLWTNSCHRACVKIDDVGHYIRIIEFFREDAAVINQALPGLVKLMCEAYESSVSDLCDVVGDKDNSVEGTAL